jgi:hypothetical protein
VLRSQACCVAGYGVDPGASVPASGIAGNG